MNTTVKSLKIDETSLNAYGSIDEFSVDDTIYDHVVLSGTLVIFERRINKKQELINGF